MLIKHHVLTKVVDYRGSLRHLRIDMVINDTFWDTKRHIHLQNYSLLCGTRKTNRWWRQRDRQRKSTGGKKKKKSEEKKKKTSEQTSHYVPEQESRDLHLHLDMSSPDLLTSGASSSFLPAWSSSAFNSNYLIDRIFPTPQRQTPPTGEGDV